MMIIDWYTRRFWLSVVDILTTRCPCLVLLAAMASATGKASSPASVVAPIALTDTLREMARRTAESITKPADQGFPLLALIQDFVVAKVSLFWHLHVSKPM